MAILQFNDPFLAALDLGIDAATFSVLSTQAEAIATSMDGVGRSLELGQQVTVKPANGGFIYIDDPLLRSTKAIEVKVKLLAPPGRSRLPLVVSYDGSYNREQPTFVDRWHELTAENYELEPYSRCIEILEIPYVLFNGLSFSQPHPFVMPSNASFLVSVKYWSGFTFDPGSEDEQNPKVLAFKSALIALMQALQSDQQGVKKFTVNNYYSAELKSDRGKDAIAQALSIFKAIAQR